MRAWLVEAKHTPKAWPTVASWVAEALTNGKADIGPNDVRVRLAQGLMHLWLMWDDEAKTARGIVVTEIADSVRGKYCNLVVVAGERGSFPAWHSMTYAIIAWAQRNGCVRLEGGGREGWQRLVKADGWRKVRTVLELRFDDGLE